MTTLRALRERVALAAVRRTLPARMAADAVAALPDGLHAAVAGSGSPLPDAKRGNSCLVVSGDTSYSPALVRIAKGADLLIHDALSRELLKLVEDAALKTLEGPFVGDAPQRFTGPLWIARDGDLYSLPAGGKGVRRARMFRRGPAA